MAKKITKLEAAKKYYQGILAEAEATIDVYLENASGIGEHPQIMAELRKQIEIYSNALDGIDTITMLQKRRGEEKWPQHLVDPMPLGTPTPYNPYTTSTTT
jgi:hypothetical protein